MSPVLDVRKAFEDSLRRLDELIESVRVERDKVKVEFEHRIEIVRFGQVNWSLFEEFFEAPYLVVPKRLKHEKKNSALIGINSSNVQNHDSGF